MDRNAIAFKVQEKVDFGFTKFNFNKKINVELNSASVDYDTLRKELIRLIDLVQKGRKFENFHSLFIYGPTGVGKCVGYDTKITIEIPDSMESYLKENNIEYEKI